MQNNKTILAINEIETVIEYVHIYVYEYKIL